MPEPNVNTLGGGFPEGVIIGGRFFAEIRWLYVLGAGVAGAARR